MSRKTRPPTQAALIINEFLLSKEAGVKVTDVTYDALKKAYEKHFSQTEVEIIKKGDEIFLLNKRLVADG